MDKHIFISYAHVDSTFTDRLIADLGGAGVDCWIDHLSLTPGTPDWEQAIREALRGASAMILVATPDALTSSNVQGEVSLAEVQGLPIFPIWAKGAEWHECIPMRMINRQFIDARGTRRSAGVDELLRALQGQGIITGLTPRLPYPDQYLERIMSLSRDGVTLSNREGVVIGMNRVALSMLGYVDEDEIIGQPIESFHLDPQAPRAIGKAMMVDAVGEVFGFQVTLLAKDGGHIPVSLSASWIYDEAGQRSGSVGLFEDLRQ